MVRVLLKHKASINSLTESPFTCLRLYFCVVRKCLHFMCMSLHFVWMCQYGFAVARARVCVCLCVCVCVCVCVIRRLHLYVCMNSLVCIGTYLFADLLSDLLDGSLVGGLPGWSC